MRVLCSWGTDNFLLFTECVLKLGLEKGGDQRQLEVDNVLFEALGVPEGDTHSLAIDFSLEKLRGEGRIVATNGSRRWRRGARSLTSGKREGSAQELDEGGLAGALCANNKDAEAWLASVSEEMVVTYLNGVGSFLLRTRRGLLTLVAWVLA